MCSVKKVIDICILFSSFVLNKSSLHTKVRIKPLLVNVF